MPEVEESVKDGRDDDRGERRAHTAKRAFGDRTLYPRLDR